MKIKPKILTSLLSLITIFSFTLPTFIIFNFNSNNNLAIAQTSDEDVIEKELKTRTKNKEFNKHHKPKPHSHSLSTMTSQNLSFSIASENRAFCEDGMSKCKNINLTPTCETGAIRLCTSNNNDSEPICLNSATGRIGISRCGNINLNEIPTCVDGRALCNNGIFKCDDVNDMKICLAGNNNSEPLCLNTAFGRIRSGFCSSSSSSSGIIIPPSTSSSSSSSSGSILKLSFASPINYSVLRSEGLIVGDIVINDFDKNSTLDIASSLGSLLLGNSNGSFNPGSNFVVGQNPNGIKTGNFNGDIYPDLAIAKERNSTTEVLILLGSATGRFSSAKSLTLNNAPGSIASSDFNNDGLLDLAVGTIGSNQRSNDNVSIFLGNGDGTFKGAINLSTNLGPTTIIPVHINRDGVTDLIISSTYAPGNVSSYFGNGDGTFRFINKFYTGENPTYITAGDFNNDTKIDIAVANYNSDNVSIHLSNGDDGSFINGETYSIGKNPFRIINGDFNSDGRLDLVVTTGLLGYQNVIVLLGNGNGTFEQQSQSVLTGDWIIDLASADFNKDNKSDLAISLPGGISVLFNSSAPCPTGQTLCYGSCVNCCTDTQCSNGQTCQNNNCACPSGTILCNDSCVVGNCCTDGQCTNGQSTNGQTCQNNNCTCPNGTIFGKITEYPVASIPQGITTGSDGNLWFTSVGRFGGGSIEKISTAGTRLGGYQLPTGSPSRIITGPNGTIWFTDNNKIGKIIIGVTPSAINSRTGASQIPEYTLPASPAGIAAGADGDIWFTEYNENKIGKISTAGTITEYTIPTANSGPSEITAGFGDIWFTEYNGNKIGKISTAGTITEYTIPTANSGPSGIIAGPGGIWFTEYNGNKIGKISTAGTIYDPAGIITEFDLPTANSRPFGITAGPDGNIWFTEYNKNSGTGNKIGRITPIRIYSGGIVSYIGRITEYNTPTANSGPFGITSGPDGNVWFTESAGMKIGKITACGVPYLISSSSSSSSSSSGQIICPLYPCAAPPAGCTLGETELFFNGCSGCPKIICPSSSSSSSGG